MRRQAGAPLLALVVLLPTMGLVIPGPAPLHGPAYDSSWAAGFVDALEWSTVHKDKLVAPLVAGAGMGGYAPDVIRAYQDGVEWAARTLGGSGSPTLFDARVRALLIASGAGAPAFTRVDAIPASMVAPVSTLVGAMMHPRLAAAAAPQAGTLAGLGPVPSALESQRALATGGAWMLGVIDGTLPELRAAEAPEEPILVDPVGFVIIGGSGDDVYDEATLAVHATAPLLVVEPGGSDVYNVDIAGLSQVAGPPIAISIGRVSVGVDLGGNDVYARRAARALTQISVLVDEAGNDAYGSVFQSGATAHAATGFAFLGDRAGDDRYYTQDKGLAYAEGGYNVDGNQASVAVLADWAGNDRYEARTGACGACEGSTHAAGENVGALGIARDFAGDDVYVARSGAYGSAEDDGSALFIDDQGSDSYFVLVLGSTSFGRKSIDEGGAPNAPTGRSLAYFIDGKDDDSYAWTFPGDPVNDGLVRVDSRPDRRWGVFVDCETPPGSSYPCPEQQDDVVTEIIETVP